MPGDPSRFGRKSRRGATLDQTTSSSLPSTLTGVAVRETSYTGKSRDCALVVTTVTESAMNNSDSFLLIMICVSQKLSREIQHQVIVWDRGRPARNEREARKRIR